MRKLLAKSGLARSAGFNILSLFVIVSLVPSDEVYYRIERLMAYLEPMASASQHVRTSPSTTISILLESTQRRYVEVEDVKIDLRYAVNPSAQVKEVKFASGVLGEERTYWIYLPPGYEESKETYPTLYLLHGMSQNHRWWVEVARVDRIATSMIAAGKIRPSIIVMPNGNEIEHNVSTTSLYDDRCQTGLDFVARGLKLIGDHLPRFRIYKVSCESDFDAYIVQDVLREIESKYRTNGESYVGGFSLGGRGAVQVAFAHDDMFDGAFGLSGNYDYMRDFIYRDEFNLESNRRLFLGSGESDQRGVYGQLNTFLFHKDLVELGVEHLYCTYDGTHSDVGWVSIMPQAFEYLIGTRDPVAGAVACRNLCHGDGEDTPCLPKDERRVDSTALPATLKAAKQHSN